MKSYNIEVLAYWRSSASHRRISRPPPRPPHGIHEILRNSNAAVSDQDKQATRCPAGARVAIGRRNASGRTASLSDFRSTPVCLSPAVASRPPVTMMNRITSTCAFGESRSRRRVVDESALRVSGKRLSWPGRVVCTRWSVRSSHATRLPSPTAAPPHPPPTHPAIEPHIHPTRRRSATHGNTSPPHPPPPPCPCPDPHRPSWLPRRPGASGRGRTAWCSSGRGTRGPWGDRAGGWSRC